MHNLEYWNAGDWLGVGPGANGRISLPNGGRIQIEMRKDPKSWLSDVFEKNNGIKKATKESKKDYEVEKIMMGLRLTNGVSLNKINNSLNVSEMEKLIDANFLKISNGKLKTTLDGRLRLNSILSNLIV